MTSGVRRSNQIALSRSIQCVADHAATRTTACHHPYQASTMADAAPVTRPTRPSAMKFMLYDSGGPVIPRSKSRAIDRSSVRSARSRWATPGGPSVAAISRSLSDVRGAVAEVVAEGLVERTDDLAADEDDRPS